MPVVNQKPWWRRFPGVLMILAIVLPLCWYGMYRLGGGG
jgi:hypothetical protein